MINEAGILVQSYKVASSFSFDEDDCGIETVYYWHKPTDATYCREIHYTINGDVCYTSELRPYCSGNYALKLKKYKDPRDRIYWEE